ncbi:hypothetical protein N7520_007994 [Penicillium odoratum]|uniref:uncharacterized protein n=1 Tax=Penicillium odoratum TaxID=1167516 RepID=UPI0025482B7B|nr:uncharacterized protein N7520_007994 [Penicillium odoratum]KAJ5760838.1 hypothetical protein N7520_007994 [Penicillium odoratum]
MYGYVHFKNRNQPHGVPSKDCILEGYPTALYAFQAQPDGSMVCAPIIFQTAKDKPQPEHRNEDRW